MRDLNYSDLTKSQKKGFDNLIKKIREIEDKFFVRMEGTVDNYNLGITIKRRATYEMFDYALTMKEDISYEIRKFAEKSDLPVFQIANLLNRQL